MDKLAFKGSSFWKKPDRMWKAKHKHFILLVILPTCLRGVVPAVHAGLLQLVDSLRRLFGQVVSAAEAAAKGVERGCKLFDPREVPRLALQLLRGLVLIEGSFPAPQLNPALHHLVHYAVQTFKKGCLDWLSMEVFERNNKFIKGLVRTTKLSDLSVAKNLQLDMAMRYRSLAQKKAGMMEQDRPPICSFHSKKRGYYTFSARERSCLVIHHHISNFEQVKHFSVARIMGVHFKANEWGCRPEGPKRCGSVITIHHGGRSRYCVVQTFIQIETKCFACVQWLSTPFYPYNPIRLVARVREIPQDDVVHCVIPVERITPCAVAVMPDEDGVHYYMLRQRGYDRVDEN